ncbi:MAG: GNAT family N-acetyltransferase [Clostridia bacterium]|nr:GNAT family N-acetyltransferase [Clostridia bacterium]MBR3095331.1 GNAT family N-acetyltransferase [Clostridia bacterium]
MTRRTRAAERAQALLFSSERPFSAHLTKWEDPLLPDKYDHNCFFCSGQPEKEEFAAALAYQRDRGAPFLKLESDAPLQNSFGLEESVTLTMTLRSACDGWRQNPRVTFGTPTLPEAEALEVRHYGPVYGEDFTRCNLRRLFGALTYHGAYLDGRLAGMCYTFEHEGCVCLDGLLTDETCRGQGVATTLLRRLAKQNEGKLLFLHADADDTPRQMYEKLGFCTVDTLYEYLCPDLALLCPPGFSED